MLQFLEFFSVDVTKRKVELWSVCSRSESSRARRNYGGQGAWLPRKRSLIRLDVVHLKRAEWSVRMVLQVGGVGADILQETYIHTHTHKV